MQYQVPGTEELLILDTIVIIMQYGTPFLNSSYIALTSTDRHTTVNNSPISQLTMHIIQMPDSFISTNLHFPKVSHFNSYLLYFRLNAK